MLFAVKKVMKRYLFHGGWGGGNNKITRTEKCIIYLINVASCLFFNPTVKGIISFFNDAGCFNLADCDGGFAWKILWLNVLKKRI